MFINKLAKYFTILLAATTTINLLYAKTQNSLHTIAINAKQDSDQLNTEKDLMLCFIDITHESIVKNPELKNIMEKITKKHMESVTDIDIKYVIKFLDGNNKTRLELLSKHVNSVFKDPATLKSFRTILAKIIQEIHQNHQIIDAMNKFFSNISNKAPIYKKLMAVEKSYSLNKQEQKDIINSKTVDQAMNVISKICNRHMLSNHNIYK